MSPEQNAEEFNWLLEKIKGVESILEIGSRFGYSIKDMAVVAKPGAKIRCIDHGQPSGDCPNPCTRELQEAMNELRSQGFDADVCLKDSHDPETLKWAKDHGPFDFIFIDGDHTYKGVKQDWEWYGPLGKNVGFHDIAGMGLPLDWPGDPSVRKLWRELREERGTQEMVLSGMGIGIVKSVA